LFSLYARVNGNRCSRNLHLVKAKVHNHADSTASCKLNDMSFPALFFAMKVGIPEFLQGISEWVEAHVAKLDSEIGDFNSLLVSCTLKLKKLGIPCKYVNCLCLDHCLFIFLTVLFLLYMQKCGHGTTQFSPFI